ncbi:IQ domain-containing protein F3 [Choloepus didactylus]|uniref:IQ domain-containing protein F3 n=1 Tax=Choloepus didactylus TaxID=27675 RepID=UPI00189F5BFE|nr:IQ domain-containing protein F3 [Choloepus didactylus]
MVGSSSILLPLPGSRGTSNQRGCEHLNHCPQIMGNNCCAFGPEIEIIVIEKQKKALLAKQQLEKKNKSAGKIQAWWRGTLVRRTLLVAALRAWMIQCWWRTLTQRWVQKQQQALLKSYIIREQAAVKLQSWVRMWQCQQHYCHLCNTVCVLQARKSCLALQKEDHLQLQYQVPSNQLQFHIEILSV